MCGAAAARGSIEHERRHEVATRPLALLLALATPTQTPALDARLEHASAYVRQFEHDFEHIVSDEHYDQRLSGSKYRRSVRQTTDGEMLFWWISDAAAWLSVRNVKSVDGRPVTDAADRFHRAFTEGGDPLNHLRHLRDESARYNIGTIFRNINYPTLALQFLESTKVSRFVFTPIGTERIDGVSTDKISYREQQEPTIIEDERGRSMFTHGTLWIAEDGSVARTNVHIDVGFAPLSMDVTVHYKHDAKLGITVPVRMTEVYIQRDGKRVAERIECTATYTNFRRFETSGRIIQ